MSHLSAQVPGAGPDEHPGTTRYDLTDGVRATEDAGTFTRRWCSDRAVPAPAAARIVLLAQTATQRGLRLRPREVGLGLRWLDADRVEVDVCSRDCSRMHDQADREGVHVPTEVFDKACDGWGRRVRARDASLWFVVDTRK